MIKPPKKLSQRNPKKLLSFRQFLAAKYPKLVVDAPPHSTAISSIGQQHQSDQAIIAAKSNVLELTRR